MAINTKSGPVFWRDHFSLLLLSPTMRPSPHGVKVACIVKEKAAVNHWKQKALVAPSTGKRTREIRDGKMLFGQGCRICFASRRRHPILRSPMPSFTSTPFAYTSWQRFGLWLLVSLLVTTGLYQGASTVDYPAYGEAAKTLMKPEFARFTFDPNKVSATELRELGLSERQAGAWIKFRGGRSTAFRRPQDIGRLYVLTDEQKTRLIALAIVNNGDGAQVQAKVVNSKKDRPKKLRPLLGVHFDPNTIPEDSLRLFGFPAYPGACVDPLPRRPYHDVQETDGPVPNQQPGLQPRRRPPTLREHCSFCLKPRTCAPPPYPYSMNRLLPGWLCWTLIWRIPRH